MLKGFERNVKKVCPLVITKILWNIWESLLLEEWLTFLWNKTRVYLKHKEFGIKITHLELPFLKSMFKIVIHSIQNYLVTLIFMVLSAFMVTSPPPTLFNPSNRAAKSWPELMPWWYDGSVFRLVSIWTKRVPVMMGVLWEGRMVWDICGREAVHFWKSSWGRVMVELGWRAIADFEEHLTREVVELRFCETFTFWSSRRGTHILRAPNMGPQYGTPK